MAPPPPPPPPDAELSRPPPPPPPPPPKPVIIIDVMPSGQRHIVLAVKVCITNLDIPIEYSYTINQPIVVPSFTETNVQESNGDERTFGLTPLPVARLPDPATTEQPVKFGVAPPTVPVYAIVAIPTVV